MSYNLVINSTHAQTSLNNQYKYDCMNGSFEIPENSEIMMTSLHIAHSWYYIPDGVTPHYKRKRVYPATVYRQWFMFK